MALSKAITGVNVSEASQFNQDGTVSQIVRYRYMVGSSGPFTLTYKRGTDTPEQVAMDMQSQVTKLVTLGVLPASEA
jgi:hypothetical protein